MSFSIWDDLSHLRHPRGWDSKRRRQRKKSRAKAWWVVLGGPLLTMTSLPARKWFGLSEKPMNYGESPVDTIMRSIREFERPREEPVLVMSREVYDYALAAGYKAIPEEYIGAKPGYMGDINGPGCDPDVP